MAKKAQPKRKKVKRKGAQRQSGRSTGDKKTGKAASKKRKKTSTKKTKTAKRPGKSNQVSAKKKVKAKKTAKVAKKATTKKKKVGRVTTSKKRIAGAKLASTAAKVFSKSAPVKRTLNTSVPTNSSRGKTRRTAGAFAPSATSQDPIRFHEDHRRIPKTHLNAKQLREFKELLLQARLELAGDVDHLTRDAYSKNSQGGEYSAMPIHMADLGTDNWEHEFTLGLIENEQERIREIDAALARIAAKTYGICVATHKKISIARLRAKPWAKYCIEYARAREEGRLR